MSRRGVQSRRRWIARRHPLTQDATALLLQLALAGRTHENDLSGASRRRLAELVRHRLVIHIGRGWYVTTDEGQQMAALLIANRFKDRT